MEIADLKGKSIVELTKMAKEMNVNGIKQL